MAGLRRSRGLEEEALFDANVARAAEAAAAAGLRRSRGLEEEALSAARTAESVQSRFALRLRQSGLQIASEENVCAELRVRVAKTTALEAQIAVLTGKLVEADAQGRHACEAPPGGGRRGRSLRAASNP